MECSDQEAARRTAAGDHSAFGILVKRHSHSIFKLAYRMTGHEQDAEDLVQETFLRAYRQIGKFDGRAAFGTWIYKICVNCCLDSLRMKKQRKEQHTGVYDWLADVAAHEPSPERLSQSREIAEMLRPAMAGLSANERSAFILRHYEGWGIDQIADVLGVQAGAAKHSVFRAVQKLRRALQPVWEVEAK